MNIEIDVNEYVGLKMIQKEYGIILGELYRMARLGYTGEYLRFDDEAISNVLRFLDSKSYEGKLDELRKVKEDVDNE